MGFEKILLSVVGTAFMVSGPASAQSVGTMTLDGLSFVSFQDERILQFPGGSTIRFQFGKQESDGSIPFKIEPTDVAIPTIHLEEKEGTLTYSLTSPASGTLRPSSGGWMLEFTAQIDATGVGREGGEGGAESYQLRFSTESASARSLDGQKAVAVSGLRVPIGTTYVQLVGATVNGEGASPKPGAAVYAVLSGSFDQLPATR